MDPEYVVNTSLPYLTSKLEDAGLTVQLGFNKTERTMFLLLNDSVKCGINQLINELLDAEPDAHHDLMDPWVPYLIERTRIDETILNKPDELRRLIRTEFCTADAVAHPQFSYARQYPGGLALTLSLDCPTPLFRLKDEQLAQCPLSIDELFHCAQKNTDDLPIERIQQFGPFTCLSAQSPFVTAKAANIPALMSRFLIQAPHGLFFTIPANHMMYYAPADPANISKQLWDLAIFGRVPVLTTTKQRPEAVVSRDIFYYSPEGTYEPITQGDNPAIQELFTNQDIDAETVRTCVDQYLSPSPLSGRDSTCPSRESDARDASQDPRRKREDGRRPRTPRMYNVRGGHRWVPPYTRTSLRRSQR